MPNQHSSHRPRLVPLLRHRLATLLLAFAALAARHAAVAQRPRAAPAPVLTAPASPLAVILLGTGTPQFNAERAGAATAILVGDRWLLVDAGNGVQGRIVEAGLSLDRLLGIAITHHHVDHDQELVPLVVPLAMRRDSTLVLGPPGTRAMVDFATHAYREDIAYRLGRTGRPLADTARIVVREVAGADSLRLGDATLRTIDVRHTIATQAYRVDAGGRSVVVSGDLTESPTLVTLARDADVLVLDGSGLAAWRRASRRGEAVPRPARRAEPAHAPLEALVRMAREAQVRCVVFTHLGPGAIDETALQAHVRDALGFRGTVRVGTDGMRLDPECGMPAGR
jgi:ribonuclease BN (tRNA processing enzyme)